MAESAIQSAAESLTYFLRQKDFYLSHVDAWVTSLRNKLKALLKDVDGMRGYNESVQLIEVANNTKNIIDSFIFKIAQQRGETSAGWMSYQSTFNSGIKDKPAIEDLGKKIFDLKTRLDEIILPILPNRSQYGVHITQGRGEASTSSNQSQIQRENRAPNLKRRLDEIILPNRSQYGIHNIQPSGEASTSSTSAVQSAAESLTYFLRQKDFYLSHVDVWVMSFRNKLNALLKDVDRMRGYNESVQLIQVANNTKNVIDSFIFKIAQQRGETSAGLMSYQSTFNSGIKDIPAIEDLGKKIFDLKTRLDEILSNGSQYDIHNIQARGEASTSLNQSQILSNRSRQLNDHEDGRSGTFALSYDDLPNYLKPCFLYFGAFPEYYKISVRKLIRIWIAEGFVQRRGEKEMEDVAEDYVEELISRSMIQVDERKSNGMAKKCRIHDHLRDLAISKAESERFLYVYGNKVPTSSIMAARLAITSGDISNCISLNSSTPRLLSLLDFSYSSTPHLLSLLDFSYESDLPEKLALKIKGGAFKFLRVMNLQSEEVNYLPDEIGDLIHLRYLLLEMPELECLPSTITRLSNLQTLDIRCLTRLSNLQTLDIRCSFLLDWQLDDIVKMEQIRHLMVDNGWFSNGMQLHHLSNLQTLKSVRADSWIEDGLEKLTNLRDLGIDEIRGDVHMALSRSISKLVHLRSLWLTARDKSWIPAFESFSKHEHLYKMKLYGCLAKLPEPHVFPPNLTELFLGGSNLDRDPMVTLEKLPNLRSLYICSDLLSGDAYMGKEMVCSAGGFPLLDTLSIVRLNVFEEWRVEEGAMPILRSLEIRSCRRLKMLPDGLRHIITLQELNLEDMSEELKERLRKNKGEDWFKIRHDLIIE